MKSKRKDKFSVFGIEEGGAIKPCTVKKKREKEGSVV